MISWFSTAQLSAVLLHFLWQGAGIALLLHMLLKRLHTSRERYLVACTALALMLLAPVITWFYLGSRPTLLDTTFIPATRVESSAGTSGAERLEKPQPLPTPTPVDGETA